MKPIRRLPAGYSSPYGRVHNPNITTKPKVYMNEGFPLNSVCAGHMVIGTPILKVQKSKNKTTQNS